MASFRIHSDTENNPDLQRQKAKDFGKNQKRSVLGVVNGNVDGFKNLQKGKNHIRNVKKEKRSLPKKGGQLSNAQEKAPLKPTFGAKGPALTERTENVKKVNGVPQKPKATCNPFQVFEDCNAGPPKQPAVKNENKARILREKKVEEVVKPGMSRDVVSTASLPFSLPPPEPMSPDNYNQQLDGSLTMDVSMRSEGKPDVKPVSDREAAAKELDYLNLTERLYMCEEYREEISLYLRALQNEHRPRKNYMLKQPDITNNMRAVLVDWLVEVVEEYNMTNETLYLAVSYIDRFLSSMSVVRAKLQLVGTAAMFIAAKYEEIYPPDVKDFVYITDDTYTKAQVLRMEHLILRVLRFDLSTPTIFNFLTDYTTHYPTSDSVKYLAMYLCELSLLDGDPYLGFLPSDIAAGALCVARAVLLQDEELLPPDLQRVLDIHLSDIMHVIASLERTFSNAESCPQQASRDKYRAEKFSKVSEIPASTDCNSLLAKELSSEESR